MKKLLIYGLSIIIVTAFLTNSGICAPNTQEVITAINNTYQKYPTIKSKFKQTDSLGKVSYGWFVFDKKNGNARIEYTNTPLRIIINNNSVMLEQTDLKEKTFSPLAASPFKYIVNKKANLNSSNLEITNFVTTKSGYNISVNSKENSFKGKVTLSFNQKFYLAGWTITDELDNITTVVLINPNYSDKKVPSYIFNTHRVANLTFNDIK